jgi:hypothetical protein
MDTDGLPCACGAHNLSDDTLAEAKVDACGRRARRQSVVVAARRVTVVTVSLALTAVAVDTERYVCVGGGRGRAGSGREVSEDRIRKDGRAGQRREAPVTPGWTQAKRALAGAEGQASVKKACEGVSVQSRPFFPVTPGWTQAKRALAGAER